MYFVSRQHYYYQDIYVVEIAYPSIDSSGPDMLISKYQGEGEIFNNPVEALEVALDIREAWRKDNPEEDIYITFGCMEFGEGEIEEDIDDLKKRVQNIYDKMPKCDFCGDLIDEKEYYINEDSHYTDTKFCSNYCSEKFYFQTLITCRVCDHEYEREDMNFVEGSYDTYLCDNCQQIAKDFESIDVEKINDNCFVGSWLEDQQIIRSILGKTYINRKEFDLLESNLNYISIDIYLKEVKP